MDHRYVTFSEAVWAEEVAASPNSCWFAAWLECEVGGKPSANITSCSSFKCTKVNWTQYLFLTSSRTNWFPFPTLWSCSISVNVLNSLESQTEADEFCKSNFFRCLKEKTFTILTKLWHWEETLSCTNKASHCVCNKLAAVRVKGAPGDVLYKRARKHQDATTALWCRDTSVCSDRLCCTTVKIWRPKRKILCLFLEMRWL